MRGAGVSSPQSLGQSLLKHGADVNALDFGETTPLHLASNSGNLEIGQWLLEHGADVNAKERYDWTPLHFAASEHFELVRILLGYRADINARTYHTKRTPIEMAVDRGRIDIVRILLDNGADPNSREQVHSTVL